MNFNNYISQMLKEKEKEDRLALREYCKEDGYEEDYENIVLPLLNKYGWELLVSIGDLEWDWIRGGEYRVKNLNLDRLSTLVDWDEKKGKFVAC